MTKKQFEIVNSILAYQRQHGRCPTYKEIGGRVDLSSTGSVCDQVRKLRRDGYLAKENHRVGRALQVIRMAYEVIWRMENGKLALVKEGK